MTAKNVDGKLSANNMLLAFVALIIIIALVALAGFILFSPKEDPVLGLVEVKELRISGKVPGRIISYRVEEGERVSKGDTLVLISTPEVEAKQTQAQALRRAAWAQSRKADLGARSEMKQGAYEIWQKAVAGVEIAKKSFDRVAKLHQEGVIPSQKYDEAEAQYKAMQATERAAKSQYDMAVNGAQREDRMAAAALVDQADGALEEIGSYLKEGALLSPIDGEIAGIFPLVGELVGTGAPIMHIADTKKKEIIFSVREDMLPKLDIGVVLKAYVPALADKDISMKVSKMKDLGSYAAWKATKTTGEIDLRTFEITAVPTEEIPQLRAGMTVVLHKGQL